MNRDPQVRRTALRLGLQSAALVVAVLAIVGLVLLGLYRTESSHAAHSSLAETTTRVDEPDEAAPGIFVTVVSHGEEHSSRDLPAGLPDRVALAAVERDGRAREGSYNTHGHGYLVRTARVGDRVVQASLDRQEAEEAQTRVVTSLLLAGGLGVVMAGLVSFWLARRAVGPLADSLAMQRRFVADASHELRTPLTLLSTRVQMLTRRREAVGPDDLAAVVADTRTLADILDDLLAAADTRSAPRTEPTDLDRVADEVVAAARAHAEDRGVELVRVPGDAPGPVPAAPMAVRRAVTALVDNALDHAETRVEVAVSSRRGEVAIAVLDDGPGIPPEVMPRIFERFASTRPTPTTAGARRHFGLGLALVADIAAVHGGRVEAGPRPDGGPGAALTLVLRRGR